MPINDVATALQGLYAVTLGHVPLSDGAGGVTDGGAFGSAASHPASDFDASGAAATVNSALGTAVATLNAAIASANALIASLTLQSITDVGATTTDAITVAEMFRVRRNSDGYILFQVGDPNTTLWSLTAQSGISAASFTGDGSGLTGLPSSPTPTIAAVLGAGNDAAGATLTGLDRITMGASKPISLNGGSVLDAASYEWANSTSAPSAHISSGSPAGTYCGPNDSVALMAPDAWVLIRIDGTDYKMPAYL